jgi:alkylhydroperoxidase family enzyme
MREEEVERLRAAGLSDKDVLDAVEVIGYFNYINRIADGLGVDAEEWMRR